MNMSAIANSDVEQPQANSDSWNAEAQPGYAYF